MGHTSNIDNEVNLNAHALFNALPQATALIDAAVQKFGENIAVARMSRFKVLEK